MPLIRLEEYNNKRNMIAHALGTNPKLTSAELAKKFGISTSFISTLKSDSDFWDIVEKEFKNHIAKDFLVMDEAMIREAKEGNVQAYRAINEKYGKFVKKFQLEVKSPYELFTNSQKDAELTEYEEVGENKIPERNPINDDPKKRDKQENIKLQKEIKHNRLKIKRREQASVRRRARAVGLELLPKGNTTTSRRITWLKELERLETIENQKQVETFELKDITQPLT